MKMKDDFDFGSDVEQLVEASASLVVIQNKVPVGAYFRRGSSIVFPFIYPKRSVPGTVQ
jgi:hypothetical protein